MRIHAKTKWLDEPADLVWGWYQNNAPVPEIALQLFSPGGELLTTATRSLSALAIFAQPGGIIVHTNGANDGLVECLISQGVLVPPLVIIPVGDEIFAAAMLSEKAKAEVTLLQSPAIGGLN